ncbi:ATPdependent RNA helicase [Perkinsus olseni]|uniref:RNA helicase n=1 Tax=Perkinsus olseni TaxID=32597 RepID=A0A7J6TTJ8_PEROL|nr:ATPdependent RNA helicase [Perkinsus olseni]KAF4748714.1 ATPdependent RNA helicase [Perkinsus olseni]
MSSKDPAPDSDLAAEVLKFMSGGKPATTVKSENGPSSDAVRSPPVSGLVGEDTAKVTVTEYSNPEASPRNQGSTATTRALASAHRWEDLDMTDELRRGILEKGFVKPSKIQELVLPLIQDGRNIIGQAQNGSGKTATFALGILSRIDIRSKCFQALILSPTRELAIQNLDVVEALGKYTGFSTQLVVPNAPGLPRNPREGRVTQQILSGTPGKVLDLITKRVIDTRNVSMFVLDEADTMIQVHNNMGAAVNNIRSVLPKNDLQILLFSATYPENVRRFALNLVPHASKIQVSKQDLTLSTIWQTFINTGKNFQNKVQILSDLYAAMNVSQSIIFVNSRVTAFNLAKMLRDEGHSVSLICGTQMTGAEQISPEYRDKIMDEFRNKVTKVLIATDVLARGIDVPAVTLVVNFELPIDHAPGPNNGKCNYETYLHRIGRTGRFGRKGIAANLVSEAELELVADIENYFPGTKVDELTVDEIDTLEDRLKKLR